MAKLRTPDVAFIRIPSLNSRLSITQLRRPIFSFDTSVGRLVNCVG
jgi:hypothetical protein